ncbi:MAG: PhnD/SsuA/transferrin family substrate-binding protein [bacterium]
MKKWTGVLLLVAVFAAAPAAHGAEKTKKADEGREYLLLLPMINLGTGAGYSISDFMAYIYEIVEIFREDFGINIKAEYIGNADMSQSRVEEALLSELLKGRGDFFYMNILNYCRARQRGASIRPLVIPTIEGKTTVRYCLYVHRNSDFNNIQDLENKRIANNPRINDWSWLVFYLLGLRCHPNEYFEYMDISKTQSQMYSVLIDEADVTMQNENTVKFLSMFDTRFKKLKPISCTMDIDAGFVIAYREAVPKKTIDKISDILTNVIKYKPFKKLDIYPFIKRLKFSFKNVDDDEIWDSIEKNINAFEKLSKEYDAWKAEYEKRKAAGTKGDYKYCKEKCAGAENAEEEVACLDECME